MMKPRIHTASIALVVSLIAAPSVSEAQRSANVTQIGFLGPSVSADDPRAENFRQFQEGLRELGYVEGKNISIVWRLVESYELYPAKAAELVGLKVAVIVTPNTPAALAAKSATTAIPIVFTLVTDPVESGLVASLSRPGGNVTGLSNIQSDLTAKRLQLLKETLPTVARVAILFNASNPGNARSARVALNAAPALRLNAVPFDARNPDQLARAFDEMKRERPDALLVLQDAFLLGVAPQVAEFAKRNRLPTMYDAREFVDVGGLMSYGPSRSELFRRVAVYVDKILKGAKPADLPVEQPTRFELIINLKTAKGLDITIPQSLLGRADEVIQ